MNCRFFAFKKKEIFRKHTTKFKQDFIRDFSLQQEGRQQRYRVLYSCYGEGLWSSFRVISTALQGIALWFFVRSWHTKVVLSLYPHRAWAGFSLFKWDIGYFRLSYGGTTHVQSVFPFESQFKLVLTGSCNKKLSGSSEVQGFPGQHEWFPQGLWALPLFYLSITWD